MHHYYASQLYTSRVLIFFLYIVTSVMAFFQKEIDFLRKPMSYLFYIKVNTFTKKGNVIYSTNIFLKVNK